MYVCMFIKHVFLGVVCSWFLARCYSSILVQIKSHAVYSWMLPITVYFWDLHSTENDLSSVQCCFSPRYLHLHAATSWVWANFVNAPPFGECRYRRAAEALLKCIQLARSGATGPRRSTHTSPLIPRRETGKEGEGLKGEQTRRREMILLLGEWRNIGTTEVQVLSIYLCYYARTCTQSPAKGNRTQLKQPIKQPRLLHRALTVHGKTNSHRAESCNRITGFACQHV